MNHPLFLEYSLRRSARVKSMRIVVKPDKIEVVAPHDVTERKIRAFVEAQQDWIKSAVLRIEEKVSTINKLAPDKYADGVMIPYQGQKVVLRVNRAVTKKVRLAHQPDAGFSVTVPVDSDDDQCSEYIRLVLTRWLKHQAKLRAGEIIKTYAARHGLQPRSLKIKTQKSRWGSCGPNNDINLNWLLMLAPLPVLEYVVVHELCHIQHKNHSAAFWGLVAELQPDFQKHRNWLKQHGSSIMEGL